MTAESDRRIVHLYCSGCEASPSYALLDGDGRLVCHCTHVDGQIEPFPVHGFRDLPDRWEFRENGEVTA